MFEELKSGKRVNLIESLLLRANSHTKVVVELVAEQFCVNNMPNIDVLGCLTFDNALKTAHSFLQYAMVT